MDHAIYAEGLTKSFADVHALAGVDLAVAPGTVLGLLGPNGAGKTTAVRILTTILRPDGGHAEVLGIDVARRPREVRRLIGLAGQYAAVDENLTGRENLRLVGRLTHQPKHSVAPRADELLERFDLVDAADRRSRRTPGACAAGSTWPPPSCTGRGCCSSTSPPPASIPAAAPTCGS